MLMDYEGKVKARKFDPRISRDMLAEAVIKHDLPYTFVEYDKIRACAKYVNPNVVMPSRTIVVSDVQRIHLRKKEIFKQAMAKVVNRICLTSDVWTTSTSEGYICLIAHFVNENWKLCSKLLNFCLMPPPHTEVVLCSTPYFDTIANKVYGCQFRLITELKG